MPKHNELETRNSKLETGLATWLGTRERVALPGHAREAAVLVPLFRRDDAWHLLFTKRSELVGSHRGQISFPGGRHEAADATLAVTALRESHEEIGLEPGHVRVLGPLDDIATSLGVRVTPYVGVIPSPYPFRLRTEEVAHLIELPVRFFTAPGSRRVERWALPDGRERDVYFFDREPEPIWGATARIVAQWLDALAADAHAGAPLLETLVGGGMAPLDGVPGEA